MDTPLVVDNNTRSKIINKIRIGQNNLSLKQLKLIRYGGDKDLAWFLSLEDKYLFDTYGLTKAEKQYINNNMSLFNLFNVVNGGGIENYEKQILIAFIVVAVILLILFLVFVSTDNTTGSTLVGGFAIGLLFGLSSYCLWRYKKNNPEVVPYEDE